MFSSELHTLAFSAFPSDTCFPYFGTQSLKMEDKNSSEGEDAKACVLSKVGFSLQSGPPPGSETLGQVPLTLLDRRECSGEAYGVNTLLSARRSQSGGLC